MRLGQDGDFVLANCAYPYKIPSLVAFYLGLHSFENHPVQSGLKVNRKALLSPNYTISIF